MIRTWNATAVIAEKVNNWLRILMAIATLLPAVMIGIAALGGEHGQFTLPQGTWFIVVMAAAVIALVACALLQFFFGRRGSGGILGVLFLGLAVVPFWAALDHGKTVFDVGIPIQILAFIPIVALIIAAIWIGPLKLIGIGMIPGAANQVLGGFEAIGRGVKVPIRLPRVPTTGRMLTWLALALVADAMLGIYLSFVTIADEPRLILPLILVTVALALLTAINKAGGFRVLLWIALIVITLIFALGGQKKTAEKMDKAATWLASHKQQDGGGPSRLPTVVINRDYCEDDYPAPTKKEVEQGHIELTMQSSCGLKTFTVPFHSWHPQWGMSKKPNRSRWVAYQYRGGAFKGPLNYPADLDVKTARVVTCASRAMTATPSSSSAPIASAPRNNSSSLAVLSLPPRPATRRAGGFLSGHSELCEESRAGRHGYILFSCHSAQEDPRRARDDVEKICATKKAPFGPF